ncbi:hypothetical protein PQX77_003304 [Marasmius sp. AFHP31]|nr:hypothetical protein PQX77_003304 [Marasmius sp. AFHP31]
MSASERNPLRLDEFLHDYAGDAALTNFDQGLRSHILCRLLGLSGDEDLPKKTLSSLIFDKNRIYIHRTYRLRYNTYNMRRKAQTINPRTHPDIMMLADAVTTDGEKHPYRYARVLGIFHANVWLFNSRMRYEDMRVQKVEFLWVRWYELDTTHRHGWKAKRFPKVRFLPASDPQAFGFVDPGAVLRGAYLEPAFNDGFVRVEETTGDFLGADSICRLYHTYQDGKLAGDEYEIFKKQSKIIAQIQPAATQPEHSSTTRNSTDAFLKKPSSSKMEKQERETVEESWDRYCAVEKAKPEDERRPLQRLQCGHILTRVMRNAAEASGPLVPFKVEYAAHRMYATQSFPATTAVNNPVAASTTAEKGNIANDNKNQHGMPINAELTSYFRKVPLPYDPDKEEAAMLLANATPSGSGRGNPVEELALQFYAKRGFKGLHSETSILTTIFALLFWNIIFANIPGAFDTKFQAGPLDFAEDSFHYARQDLFNRDVIRFVGVRWDVCPHEDLLEADECLKNDTLVCICRLFCEDYAARARRVPDLFARSYDKRECMFVEVKGPGGRPSETQKLWFDTLLNARDDAEIRRINELTFKGVNNQKRKKDTEKETLQKDVPVRGDDEEAVVKVAHCRTRSRLVTFMDGDGEERECRVVESPQKKRKTM